MNAPADKNVCPPSFVAVRIPDTLPFPLSFLYSFPATSEIKAETWDLESHVSPWPCSPALSLSQTCSAVLKLPLALPRLRTSPNPGEAREVMDERGESGVPRICCPPWAPSPWVGRVTRLCSHPRAFGEGLKQGNDYLHPVTGMFC